MNSKILRVSEFMYLGISALSLVELIRGWGSFDANFAIYSIFLLVGIFMFYFRRRTRLRLEARQKGPDA